jgi:hypothetical protein
LLVLDLVDGGYAERRFTGEEPYDAAAPFPVRIVPAALIR